MTDTIMPHDDVPTHAPTVTTTNVIIDPVTAKRWLADNTNRRLRPQLVKKYAHDMAAGRWKMTGEAVKFDWNGVLRDGQHRLSAIVLAGATIVIPVVRGLDPDSQAFMDQGAGRTAADALNLRGEKNPKTLAATAKLALLWEAGEIRFSTQQSTRVVSHAEIFQFIAGHDELHTAVGLADRLRPHTRIRPAVLAFTIWLTSNVDAEASIDFFGAIAESRTDGPGDPRLALIRRLDEARARRERIDRVSEAFFVIRAWNAWRTGASLKMLKLTGSAGARAFPEPI